MAGVDRVIGVDVGVVDTVVVDVVTILVVVVTAVKFTTPCHSIYD